MDTHKKQTEPNGYKGPKHDGEYERLRVQHEMVKQEMKGKLLFAPADLSKPNIRILDSATADGFWLVDISTECSPTAEFVGADIAPDRFMGELPFNFSLKAHSIFDVWPAELHESFDLVHQRFVLPICSDEASLDAIAKLMACVKPGGLIELHDGDMGVIAEGPEHAAMERFRAMMQRAWKMLGHNLSPGPKLPKWLKQAGAVDVHETILTHKCGAMAADKTQGERAISVLLALLDGMEMLGQKFPDFFFTPEDFEQLRIDLVKELNTVGNYWNTHVVWARKPQ